jgi:hypothetical protein
MNELMTWLRFSEAEAVATRDGLFSRASGNPAVPRWLARILLQVLFTAKSENEKYSAQILSSSGIAVFVSEQNDRSHWTGMPAPRLAGDGAWLEMRFYQSAGRSFGERRPDLVVRFGYGPELPKSLRRSAGQVTADA